MKKSFTVLVCCCFLAGGALADGGVIDKTGSALERGAEATVHGIKRGVEAMGNGIQRGAEGMAEFLGHLGQPEKHIGNDPDKDRRQPARRLNQRQR